MSHPGMRAVAFTLAKAAGLLAAFGVTAFALRTHPRVPVANAYSARLGDRVVDTAHRLGLQGEATKRGLEVYEFADFECPACKGSQAQIHDLAASGKITLTFIPYVIASHPGSEAKALAYLAVPSAAGRARLAEPLWRASRFPDHDLRVVRSFAERGAQEKLAEGAIAESRQRLAVCLQLAREARIVAVPTFLVRSPDGRWSVTNGGQTVEMLAEGRMRPPKAKI